MRNFRNYHVWEQSHQLVLSLYNITKEFPSEERFGLISQLRRAVISIPTNISEGCAKISEKDFARYLGISYGSCQEVEYLTYLAKDLGYMSTEIYDSIQAEIVSIKKQLYQLIKKLNAVD
ncbi:four helix bundle protein [Dyadobacter tibetensis]|uniref:four helix bundle protein n=1 Tax=Dyadobacter tibetensis TaxID=1211851 RepID=UPI000471C683|nr:four helix bundle protein [Dyadobacter tibetensis]